MSWIQTVDKNEIKRKFNIACTLSVRLTFLGTSKDNKAIHPTWTRTRFCTARNTVWTELLHNCQLHPWLLWNSALRTGFREQEQHKQLISFMVFITSLQEIHSCQTKTGAVTYPPVLHVSVSHDYFQEHRLSDCSQKTRRSALTWGFVPLSKYCQYWTQLCSCMRLICWYVCASTRQAHVPKL